ncbi:hypothetical protein GCM10010172_47050 [Paractinoplanes ferrugineus]|uniref:Uncharacterized protein n=1 Tax=Paractinoplanes ferrugineus TaxID=113564 RepID=A0A919IY34_9ACTN|nr:hypothetical protein [Actinoplanes ferrugineus]GIE10289.1 hypothetical protein Afe05nite_21290 [Actinoplanes ferrugineus]
MERSFLPSRDGFAFANRWPRQPAVSLSTPFGPVGVGNAAGGLCGGMVFAALDYWHAEIATPADQPGADHPLYRFFVHRLVDSWHFPAGLVQYYRWMNLPDADVGFSVRGRRVLVARGLRRRTVEVQWARIAKDLDRSVPVPLGVVTAASRDPRDLALNHQVLAVGYTREADRVMVRVYDPNRGRRDDTFIAFDTGTPGHARTFDHNLGLGDRPVRGFFRAGYRPRRIPT